MKTETFLPGFGGFYGSIHEFNDDSIQEEDILESLEGDYAIEIPRGVIDLDVFSDVNYKEYSQDYSKAYVDCVEEFLNDSGITIKFVYQNLYDPGEYNLTTDSINVECEYIPEEIIKIIEENKSEFDEYIRESYTSRSGFISSYSADGGEWLEEIKSDGFGRVGSHKMGACLEFILELYDFDEVECSSETRESGEIYESSYLEIKELEIDSETEKLLNEISDAIDKGKSQFEEYSKTMKPDSVERQREGFNKNIKELKEEYNEVLMNCIVD